MVRGPVVFKLLSHIHHDGGAISFFPVMQMQFNALGALLLGRVSENGRSECTTITSNEIHCTAETGVNTAVLAIIKMYKVRAKVLSA